MTNLGPKNRSGTMADKTDGQEVASALTYAASDSMSELILVTKLMQELYSTIRANKDTREQLEDLAADVVSNERKKTEILKQHVHLTDEELEELVSRDLNSHIKEDEDEAPEEDPISDTETVDGNTVNDLIKEKIRLQVQLQKLNKVDEKSTELLDRFKSALHYITILVENYATKYPKNLEDLERSFQHRLQEEDRAIDACKRSQAQLNGQLASLHGTLESGTAALQHATDKAVQKLTDNVL